MGGKVWLNTAGTELAGKHQLWAGIGSRAGYIGRVGALAVTLGIGGALSDSAATAWADEPSSRTSSSVDSSSPGSRHTTKNASGARSESNQPARSAASTPSPPSASRERRNKATLSTSVHAVTFPGRAAASAATVQSLTAGGPEQRKPTPSPLIDSGTQTRGPLIQSATATLPRMTGEPRAAAAVVGDTPVVAQPTAASKPTRLDLRTSMAEPRTAGANSVIEDLRICACRVALQAIEGIGQLVAGGESGTSPATPVEIPFFAAVTAWIRREVVDRITTIPVVAQIVRAVDDELTKLTQNFVDRLTITTQEIVKCANPTQDTPLPADLDRTVIASGLDQPTDFRFLPNGDIVIVEKTGAVKLVRSPGQGFAPETIGTIAAATDRELAAVELDPHFTDNGFFYVAYTTTDYRDRLSRFTLADGRVDVESEFVLVEQEDSGAMHHGNTVLFGPDDKIYWAVGDNSLASNGQDLATIYGKILRINPDGTIPEDNPFNENPEARKEIYAYGFRNPFRMIFTNNGKLLVGDVGDKAWEELNNVVAGGNYGWPSAEGTCEDCGYEQPVYTYPHTPPPGRAGSITTVTEYRGTALPEAYRNKVLISDYTLRWIKMLTLDADFTTVLAEETLDTEAGTTVQLLEGPDGNLYQLNIYPGELYRIAASDGNREPTAVLSATPTNGYSPLSVQFSSAGSSDPDPGTTLLYAWDFGDGATSSGANPMHTYTANGAYTASLTVSDGEKTNAASQQIVVGSSAPQVEIITPIAESKYNAGDIVSFTALATDAEDGELPDDAYEWTIVFHHADHTHPYKDDIIGPSGTVTLSTSDHNVDTTWYRFSLTVTDSSGLTATQSVNIRPNLVTLTISSDQPDATFTVDGVPYQGTHTEQAVTGVVRVLDAPSPQEVDGVELIFNRWSDGGAQQHTISTPPSSTTYTVSFDRVTL